MKYADLPAFDLGSTKREVIHRDYRLCNICAVELAPFLCLRCLRDVCRQCSDNHGLQCARKENSRIAEEDGA